MGNICVGSQSQMTRESLASGYRTENYGRRSPHFGFDMPHG